MSELEFKKLAKEIAGKERNSSSILLLSVATLIIVLILWAAVTELDSVVRGSGKTISEAKNQLVQSSEAGVIRKQYVSEGDIVKSGELLFDIDPVDAKAQLDQIQKRAASLRIRSVRLNAEINGTTPNFSNEIMEAAPSAISTELALFRARLDGLNTKSAILEQRRLQRLNEIQELKIRFNTAQKGLTLIRQEIATVEPLVRSGLAAETMLINLRREEETAIGEANGAESAQKRLLAALNEIDEQLNAERQSYLTSALTDLSTLEGELAEISARLPALESRVERTSVRSPVDGVVNRLNYTTSDAYVRTGDVLLEIVPTGSDLIVETQINPKDIAEIKVDQEVKISLSAYDPTRYGRIDGKVMSVSADAITNEQTGQQYYLVEVSIVGTLFEDDGTEVTILPGMVADIDVLAGKRTILDYFWQPMARTKSKALRD